YAKKREGQEVARTFYKVYFGLIFLFPYLTFVLFFGRVQNRLNIPMPDIIRHHFLLQAIFGNPDACPLSLYHTRDPPKVGECSATGRNVTKRIYRVNDPLLLFIDHEY